MPMETFSASGKLMLFGEYLVLSGSLSLAIPLKWGQTLSVEKYDHFLWEGYEKGNQWFSLSLDQDLNIQQTNNQEAANILVKLLTVIRDKNPGINLQQKYRTEANFTLAWGIGSSSTLISLLTQWSNVDWRTLLESTFKGSGYDVACATANAPLLFSINGINEEVKLNSTVTDQLLFVYSGKKQSSRDEIQKFNQHEVSREVVDNMNTIINKAIKANSIEEFEIQMNDSEDLLSNVLKRETIGTEYFSDYPFSTKSLGAWGGDFFMASYRKLKDAKTYFENKGFTTSYTYKELIK